MEYNFELNDASTKKHLKILTNQTWKLLPIFEGKDMNNKIVHSREEAYDNFQKQLVFLITKIKGASMIWKDNQYYYELAMMLNGMTEFKEDEHDRVKYIVNHCTRLISNMEKVLSKDV